MEIRIFTETEWNLNGDLFRKMQRWCEGINLCINLHVTTSILYLFRF